MWTGKLCAVLIIFMNYVLLFQVPGTGPIKARPVCGNDILEIRFALLYVEINIMGTSECQRFVGITAVPWGFCWIVLMLARSHHVSNPTIGIRNTYVFVLLVNILIQNKISPSS